MPLPFPEPTAAVGGPAEVLLGYLDFFRDTALAKVSAMPPDEARRSRLPSGWTPVQLLHHLRHVELRWIEWGFEGRPVPEPWGDRRDDRWFVDAGRTLDELTSALRKQGAHTRAVVRAHDLATPGAPGPRWNGAAPATLERVLLHLLQEYARHVGHLDIVAELAGGPVGE